MESLYDLVADGFYLLVGPEPTFVVELEIFVQSILEWIW